MTKAEQDMAPPAGQSPGKPDMSNEMAATAPDPARVFFDLATSRLSLGGDLIVTNTTDPLDPIIGRGIFEFDPMILIGPTDNGAIHLSDTTFRILDTQTGDSLLSAFLLEVAYMPSTLPGFAGMIQAYLDIPPDFAGGISNTIDSPFLDGMSAARAVGEQATFWFFADQPLFDSQGTPQISGSGGTGNLKIGIAIPEPSTVVLLFGGALGYLPLLYRKRSRMAPHSKNSPRRLLA